MPKFLKHQDVLECLIVLGQNGKKSTFITFPRRLKFPNFPGIFQAS
jgi:hypothetical protein